MLQKFNDLSLKTYVTYKGLVHNCKQFVRDFKEDDRGLSGVVVAVLLILVAVLAVLAIWGGLGKWLGELWQKITGDAKEIDKITLPDGS